MLIRVRGSSMMPQLRPGEWLWATRRLPLLSRGLLLLIELPEKPEAWIIKRLIGLPGEYIQVSGGAVRVGEQSLTEPYILSLEPPESSTASAWRLSTNQIVVLGDARDDSLDSRRLGPLPKSSIRASVTRRVWPPLGKPLFLPPSVA